MVVFSSARGPENWFGLEGAGVDYVHEVVTARHHSWGCYGSESFRFATLYDGRSKSLTADMNTMQCLRHLVATRVVVCSPDEHTSVGHRRKLVQTFCSPIPVLMQAKTSPSKFD